MTSRKVWHAFVVTLVNVLTAGRAEHVDKATSKVTTACWAAQYLHKLASKLERGRPSAQELSKRARQAAMAYRIKAVLTQDQQDQVAFLAMAAVTEQQIAQVEQEAVLAAETYNRAIRLVKQQEAAMLTLHRAASKKAALTATAHTASTSLGGASSIKACASTATVTLATDNCTLDTDTAEIKTAEINENQHTKINIMDVTRTTTTYTVTAYCKGTVSSNPIASPTLAGGCIETGTDFSSDGSNYAAATLAHKQITYTPLEVNLYADKHKGACTEITKGQTYTEYDKDTLANALCNIRHLKKPTYTPIHRRPWTAVTADEKLLQVLTDLITPGGKAPTEQQAKKALTDAYLGSDQNVFTARITDSIDKTTLNLKVRETTFDKTIFETAGSDGAATVLTYFQGKQLIDSRAAATETRKPQATEENKLADCKGTEEDDCNKEKCDSKEEKCQVKVTTAGGTDGKTNTTGSNSLVIKKAPLLLAFLILA
ncbi:variant surface glycoprotein [Trypanosoma brucei equiperdum]|uniref:Variant surface glycoprotein n=1 Tax=Trypanosoma brucei equiperdum TaxID=630700 RepID=A0A3L6LD79_9TRYP|nr:variant surface glycoprotein [Trypanosoma brucei equiperdum]RHW73696.1 variant surface glycoprotein [Trypanosoma brucei equiperdum]RHW73743.1 variant surface glycoprotein [Trypanosoma brucei equiperdum]RHW73814.1 variant surface glycoprotein [Trypanosoma brucei equiperdum]